MKHRLLLLTALAGLLPCGCRQALITRTDGAVYQLIENRQRAALGMTSNAHIGPETGKVSRAEQMYRFVPRPLQPEVPETFRTPPDRRPRPDREGADDPPVDSPLHEGASVAADFQIGGAIPDEQVDPPSPEDEPSPSAAELTPSIFANDELDRVMVFGLRDALAYATAHARELKAAREDLYFAALDLTLERHLWTPQFVASIDAALAEDRQSIPEDGEERIIDRTMQFDSLMEVTQALPYGGEVIARVVNALFEGREEPPTSLAIGRSVTSSMPFAPMSGFGGLISFV
jgi:hypothetical protein